jgi:membrane protease YdiL (CAAX protease family)
VRSCPSCGGSSPPQARWCGLCCATFDEPAPAVATLTRPLPPPLLAPQVDVLPASTGRMLAGRALVLTLVAIGVGIVGALVSWQLSSRPSMEPETFIRYAIVITIGVYAIVGALLVTQLVPGIRLRWNTRGPAAAVLMGAAVGGGLAGVFVLLSRSAGNPAPDSRIIPLMSEGDAAHIVVTLLILCGCAPVIEEVLFRGLLLESLRTRRTAVALVVSGVAFSAWHLNPSPATCVYYVLMGLLLGSVYLRRGLVGSMAAHAAFNGVLAMAALAVVLSPDRSYVTGDVSLRAPGGWGTSQQGAADLADAAAPAGLAPIALDGPSGSGLMVLAVPSTQAPSADTVFRRIRTGAAAPDLPGVSVATSTTRELSLPAGRAVAVDVTAEGHDGTLVLLPLPDEVVTVVFLSGGSAKARADFPRMLDTLEVG